MSDLNGLVKKWRDDAKRAANGPMCDGASEYAVAGTYMACSDELEAALAQHAGAVDRNVESVRTKMLERSAVGLAKYGVTTERGDLSHADWLKHLQEELMDATVYIEAALASSGPGGGGEGVPNGSWLWGKLMDWCQSRRIAPADYDDLFAIATEAHKLNAKGNG